MLRHVIRAAAAGAIMSAWAFGAHAAPVGGLATGLKSSADQGNGLQQVVYRCWYHHGVRHCRWYPGYYYGDDWDYGPYYGYGPGIGLYFGGGGGGFRGGHFGGGHFGGGGHHH